jgi:PDZ domain-containing protein
LEQADTSSPALSQAQSDSIESALLTSSADTALIVAQHHLALRQSFSADGATVLYVTPHSAAALAQLTPADRITQVNATPVTQAADLATALATPPTTPTSFTVVRNGATLHLTAPVTAYPQPDLGLTVSTATTGSSPYTLSLPGVGGPSGGLLLALTYTSALSTGSLTGPNTVAGTGTLDTAGNIGSIAGITQKVQAAAAAGATVFFAPSTDSYAATTAAQGTKLTVVPVSTYTQALHWLCAHHATSSACQRAS